MKVYMDTSVLAVLTHFKNIELDRYKSVSKLVGVCKSKGIEIVISFYALHELFLLSFDYFDEKTARTIGKTSVTEILNIEGVELIELLSRKNRLLYQEQFNMNDRTDIPHAISAFVEGCDSIITYDTHFDQISHLINVSTPESFIDSI